MDKVNKNIIETVFNDQTPKLIPNSREKYKPRI